MPAGLRVEAILPSVNEDPLPGVEDILEAGGKGPIHVDGHRTVNGRAILNEIHIIGHSHLAFILL